MLYRCQCPTAAGGAARYFAADNYYTKRRCRPFRWMVRQRRRTAGSGGRGRCKDLRGESSRASSRMVPGSEPISASTGPEPTLRSRCPRSWSLLALVGGDQRILDAYAEAVKETLTGPGEEPRRDPHRAARQGQGRRDRGNLLAAALFVHDTNRNQEPNARIHAVVAERDSGTGWQVAGAAQRQALGAQHPAQCR